MSAQDLAWPHVITAVAGPEYWFREGCYITELWNAESDPAVSVVRARIEAGGVTRWHQLDAITERYLVLSGQGRVQLGDRTDRTLVAGDAIVIPPRVSQRIANTGAGDLVFLAVCTPRFRPEAYRDVDGAA